MTSPTSAAATSSGLSAAVGVLVDPDDTGECVAELGARHDPDHGVVVCHPRSGAAPLPVLGEDVLVALGKRPGGLVAEGVSRRGWALAGMWLRAERIEHLVVLRAHLLPPSRWRELAALTAAAGTKLWLVVHQGGLGTGHRAALDGTGAGLAPVRPWRVALALLPTPAEPVLGPFPEVPDVEFPLFRTAARRLLDSAGFARVDAVYRPTLLAARDLARRWTRPGTGLASIDPHHAAAALQRHTIDATSLDEVLTRVRAVQAGFCTAGVFLKLPRRRPGLPAAGVSYAPRLDPVTVERLRGLCSPTAAAALAIARVTGLRSAALRSLRVRDVHDTGPDQLLIAERTLYRIPAPVAGMVRAAILEHHAQRVAHDDPATSSETGAGGAGLFVGTEPGTVIGEQALQNVLDRGAAYTGVPALGPVFRGVEVHDLRGRWA